MIAGRDWSSVRVVGVSRLANYLKRKLESDRNIAAVGVEGEISNLRIQPSGSVNFSLKDRDALLDCFAYAGDGATFPELKNGDAIVAFGRVSLYERKSAYQLVVRHVELAGLGRLFQRYNELRTKLEAEGLFREERKRRLPRFPFQVALVGSPTGEGTRDFLTQARARAPHVAVRLFPTAVQGDVAPQIVAALQRACESGPDLVVLARGGGSYEDLFVFSDERLVRAIAACAVPIATAIGHEGDISLADLAADHRASTPSTAAQTVLPRRDDLLVAIRRDASALTRALSVHVARLRHGLERVEHRSALADPVRILAARRQRVDAALELLRRRSEVRVRRARERLAGAERRLLAASPRARLAARRERLAGLRRLLTPSAGARIAAHRRRFAVLQVTLNSAEGRIIAERLAQLHDLEDRLGRRNPSRRLAPLGGRLDETARRLTNAAGRVLERRRGELKLRTSQLEGNNPEALLQRGYAIVKTAEGVLVRDPVQAPPGTRLQIRVARGELAARVERDGPDAGEQIGLF